jgi:hypothetical protein
MTYNLNSYFIVFLLISSFSFLSKWRGNSLQTLVFHTMYFEDIKLSWTSLNFIQFFLFFQNYDVLYKYKFVMKPYLFWLLCSKIHKNYTKSCKHFSFSLNFLYIGNFWNMQNSFILEEFFLLKTNFFFF